MKPNKDISELVLSRVDANGELHIDKHRTTLLVEWLKFVERILAEYDAIDGELRKLKDLL